MHYIKKIKEQKRTHYFLSFYIAAFFFKFLNNSLSAAQYKTGKKKLPTLIVQFAFINWNINTIEATRIFL